MRLIHYIQCFLHLLENYHFLQIYARRPFLLCKLFKKGRKSTHLMYSALCERFFQIYLPEFETNIIFFSINRTPPSPQGHPFPFSTLSFHFLYILFKMNRNPNKPNQSETSPQYQRKFISPNQLRSNLPAQFTKTNKNEEYRSTERSQLNTKGKETDPTLKAEKNKSQTSNQAQFIRNNHQKEKSQLNIEAKESRNSSKSKERKDYMTANLSKFNRKKEEKRSPSNTSERSNHSQTPKQQKKQKYIYTFKEEIKANEKVKAEYAGPSSITNKTSRLEEKSQKSSHLEPSEVRSNNTSVALSSRGKPLQINVVKYQDRKENNFSTKEQVREIRESQRQIRRQSQKELQRQVKQPPKETLSPPTIPTIIQTTSQVLIQPPPSQKRLPITEATRMQMELSHQYEAKYSEQLMNKLRNQREEFAFRLRTLQNQRQRIQQTNTHLLQEKYQLQAQLTIMSNSTAELQREVESMREAAVRSNKETERTNTNNERMFKQLEERYNSLLQEYRLKLKQNADLSLQLNETENHVEQLKNGLRSVEEELKNRGLEVEKTKRIYEARMGELKQQHEFQMKQFQIRTSDKNKRDLHLQESTHQLQRELQAKNKEISIRDREIKQLSLQLRDMEELKDLYNVKCAQNSHLLDQLNKNKEHFVLLTQQNSEITQRSILQAKEKDKRIKELTNTLLLLKNKEEKQKLNSQAQLEFQGGESQSSFQELIKSQSEQTNKLRSQLSSKDEQLYKLGLDNDELRQRVRRLEQQHQLNSRTYAMNLNNLKEMKDATEMMLKKRIATLQSVRNIH